ncbi:hypothetical protein ACHHYP_02625 [Achlya hypogyna]|uniref:Histidine acid phosphatase n=1 Tax=Achlya hypogyna TaxID=1202772 RepID=A0A1V9Z5S2_ACHHY|nr:hypothetical protein ACHHYP_02625 [Achlya hypogyna]
MRLRLVQVLHRHGDRSPLHNVFAGGRHRAAAEDALWVPKLHAPSTAIYGQLTTTGIEQMQARGSQVRAQCKAHGWTLNSVDLRVQSTPYDRTQQSTAAFLSCFLPSAPRDIDVLPKHLNFINAYSANGNVIIPMKLQLIADKYAADEARMADVKAELIHRLPMFSVGGEEFTWMKAADHFICRHAHAIEYLPDTAELSQPAINHLALRFQQYYTDPTILRLVVTGLGTELLAQMEHCMMARNGDSAEVVRIYSGHDVSLLALLYGLRVDLIHPFWPDYGAAVVLELFQDGHDWFVRVTLDGAPVLDTTPFAVFASSLRSTMKQ